METPSPAQDFEAAAGSVAGRDHRRAGRPNQDGFALRRGSRSLVAAVTDGCGSGRESEIGARLGARLWVEALGSLLDRGARVSPATLEEAACRVAWTLGGLAAGLGAEPAEVVRECLLFTLVGAALTPEVAALHAVGDGACALEDELVRLGPFPDNRPPYLADRLAGRAAPVALVAARPAAEIDSLVLATDGAVPFGDSLALLARDDALFRNPDALRRRLELAARERVEVDWERRRLVRGGGPLTDDATVLALRRRRA